jgi:hypothetical protein
VGTQSVSAPEDYCREIEAYLCRKNDGHLVRIVGPAFEQVTQWARDGIPLKVACAGVDRYFDRYYRKGARRRPVRIEFCEADVRDAFDDWRRAVGVARLEPSGEEESSSRRRSSLATHLERVLARLTALRGSTQTAAELGDAIDTVVRRLDVLLPEARRARGDARAALAVELETLDRQLVDAATAALSNDDRARLALEAVQEIEPFRGRMLPETFAKTRAAALERAVRDRFGLPSLGYH